jgi:hypothetical protein
MRLDIQQETGQYRMSLFDNDRKLASVKAKTVSEAAKWLVAHVNRITEQTEALLVAAGHLTHSQIDAIVDAL